MIPLTKSSREDASQVLPRIKAKAARKRVIVATMLTANTIAKLLIPILDVVAREENAFRDPRGTRAKHVSTPRVTVAIPLPPHSWLLVPHAIVKLPSWTSDNDLKTYIWSKTRDSHNVIPEFDKRALPSSNALKMLHK
jgi:hypothetical protein